MKYTRLVFIIVYCILSQVLHTATVLSEVVEAALLFSREELFSGMISQGSLFQECLIWESGA